MDPVGPKDFDWSDPTLSYRIQFRIQIRFWIQIQLQIRVQNRNQHPRRKNVLIHSNFTLVFYLLRRNELKTKSGSNKTSFRIYNTD
jgi:hypothetical protein